MAVKALYLSWQQLQDHHMPDICSFLRKHKIESLDLSHNHITSAGLNGLFGIKSLVSLDISFNELGEKGAIEIADNMPHLEKLDISCNEIGQAIIDITAKLQRLTELKSMQIPPASSAALNNLSLFVKKPIQPPVPTLCALPEKTAYSSASRRI